MTLLWSIVTLASGVPLFMIGLMLSTLFDCYTLVNRNTGVSCGEGGGRELKSNRGRIKEEQLQRKVKRTRRRGMQIRKQRN